MDHLLNTVKQTLQGDHILPFAVYSSIKEQHLLNVPILKPVLIVVLNGEKELGCDNKIDNNKIICHSGRFIFLADNPAINMRNIPKDNEYFALLIEFELQDFQHIQAVSNNVLSHSFANNENFCMGEITPTLNKCLQQFVEWSLYAPQALWPLRRRELMQLLCTMGYENILAMVGNSKIKHKVHALVAEQPAEELSVQYICEKLAMSESTLRRKLKLEGTSTQEIKDQVKLGLGLHLLQTTTEPIGLIAEQCGYHSQSRFTDRFKSRFGLTPSELRKTKLTD